MKLRFKLILLSIFFFSNLCFSYSEDKSQDTGSGLEKQAELPRTPRVEFIEKIMKEQEKTLSPAVTQAVPERKQKLSKKTKAKGKKTGKQETEATQAITISGTETEERQYYLDTGDVLDISVFELTSAKKKLTEKQAKEKEDEEYRIDIGDVLDISVWQVPDLSRPEVIVTPDGKISFPLIGNLKVEGLNLTQLNEVITEKLKPYVKNPQVSIMIRRFGARVISVSELSRQDVIIRPDGKISFPLIGDLKVEGLNLTQLNEVITEKLNPYVRNPQVSIMIRRFGEEANKVVVLGEILSPGIYKFGGSPTIIEAVASAGGYTKYAVLNSIMIIRGDVRTKPEVIRANVASVLKSGKLSENVLLKPNDIVYVPRSFIGNLNTFLEIIQPAIGEYLQTLNAKHLHNTVHRKGGI